jgi:hypothetical protein
VGPGQRPPEDVIRYRLGDVEATRRARWAAGVGAISSLAPVGLAIVLLHRLGWAPTTGFWAIVGGLVTLVVTRAGVVYSSARRKLAALRVTLSEEDIQVASTRDGYAIARPRVARIVEIDGSLGGLRVESYPDARSGMVFEVRVPGGGEGYAEVRARLESWRTIERRGRRAPRVRVAIGALVVAGIFFVPFLLDDFVAHSKLVAAGLVAAMWLVMRGVTRGR